MFSFLLPNDILGCHRCSALYLLSDGLFDITSSLLVLEYGDFVYFHGLFFCLF